MSPRPPADGVVALRSLPRRSRAPFAGLDDDERPDALSRRPGAEGTSALGHLAAATEVVRATGRGIEQLLSVDGPLVDAVAVDAAARATPDRTLEEQLSELGWEAEALADRTEHLRPEEWARTGTVAGTGSGISAADLFWHGIDAALAELKAAERALDEARRAR